MFIAKTHKARVKPVKEIPADAIRMLKSCFFAYLGTSEPGCLPHLTAMFYIWDDESESIFLITSKGSKKISNIRKNTKVCVTIDERNAVSPASNRGVMIQGRAMMVEMELAHDDITLKYLEKYANFLGSGYPMGNRIAIRIEPRVLFHWQGTKFMRWKQSKHKE
ncbi:MAG: pyridoxamine 5'-phosphate oxidase family protein [Candidatus Hodarchaeota archaeon]